MATVHFDFTNTDDHAIVAQAVPNMAPAIAARYLRKTECFCFNNQAFAAGESKRMPVAFTVDPALPADIDRLTLAYTYFDVRSEEHTSELQSLMRISYAVFCLKKKNATQLTLPQRTSIPKA